MNNRAEFEKLIRNYNDLFHRGEYVAAGMIAQTLINVGFKFHFVNTYMVAGVQETVAVKKPEPIVTMSRLLKYAKAAVAALLGAVKLL